MLAILVVTRDTDTDTDTNAGEDAGTTAGRRTPMSMFVVPGGAPG